MKRKPNKGQRYFPNSCEAIRNTPDKYFPSMPYEQFEDWKVYGYQIPESVFAIIRMKAAKVNIQRSITTPKEVQRTA